MPPEERLTRYSERNKMEVFQCPQLSDEWYKLKCGVISASHFSEVLNTGSGRKTYMMRLLAERMTEQPQEGYSNSNMEWGIETEPQARQYYQDLHEVEIEQVGFVKMNDDVGCSPDGLIGDDGIIEIKCPLPSTHLDYIIKNKLPSTYVPQVQGQLWVCDRQWCDFVSFDPRVTKRPYWSIRIERDENYIKKLSEAVNQFVEEIHELEIKLQESEF
jgi:putative phage-type endonuclease